MEENEDEPDDVKNATPVEGDIKSGERDEKAGKSKSLSKKKDGGGKKSSRCEKDDKPVVVKLEADKCCTKIAKPSGASKTMSVLIYSPPCTLPRMEIIPRHCLSKKEYIDILATPSRKCPMSCFGKTVIRKMRPISARMNELAQPARRLIVGTLQERGETLPPEMISNLVKSIEGSTCMTPEQAEQYFRDKERVKERKNDKCPKQRRCKDKAKSPCPSGLDKEAVMCQYLMAERFVKSILQWKCPIPVDEFKDIANVILRRLSFVLEYTPLDEQEDLKSQQMRFLADIVACWISGVLFEVAEEHKKELEEEQLRADQAEEEDEEEEEETDEDEEEPITHGLEPGEEEEEEEEEEKDEKMPKDTRSDENKEPKTDERPIEPPETESKAPIASDEPSGPPVTVKPEPSGPADETVQMEKELAEREKEEKARKEAEEQARKEAEEKARKEAEEKARKEAEEKAIKEAEEKAIKEAEEKARKEAEEKAREEAEEKARLEEEKRKQAEEKEEEERKKKKEMEEAAEKSRLEEEEEKKKKKKQQADEEAAEEKRRKEAEEKKKQEEEEEKRLKEEEENKKKKKEKEDKLMDLGPESAINGIGEGKLFKTDLPFVTFGKILDTLYDMLADEPEGDETDIIHNRIQRALYEKLSSLVESESPETLTENLKDVIDVTSGKIASWLKNVLKDSEAKLMAAHPPEVESKEIRNWGRWIDQVTDRAVDWADWIHRVVREAEGKSMEPIHRGDWQNWTGDTDTKALLWRRYYLETVHQAHHNKMMMADRPVVKMGQKGAYANVENAAEEEIGNTDLVA